MLLGIGYLEVQRSHIGVAYAEEEAKKHVAVSPIPTSIPNQQNTNIVRRVSLYLAILFKAHPSKAIPDQ